MTLQKTNILIQSDQEGVFTDNELTDDIILTFSDDINIATASDGISLKWYGDETELPIELTKGNSDKEVKIILNGIRYDSLRFYVLEINTLLRSTDNKALESDFLGYFVLTPDEENASSVAHNRTVVISDVHMGDARSQKNGYGWFVENKSKLVSFLDYLISKSERYKELVIAGDLFDEWVAPMDVATFGDENGKILTESQFALKIAEANIEVINKFKELKSKGIKITYVPGNHDMLVTAEDFDAIFGAGVVDQARDVRGLGAYTPSQDVIIEHGHRYDFYNAPDFFSNIGTEGVGADNAILPAGFFITKYATSSDINNPTLSQGLVTVPLQELNLNAESLDTEIEKDDDTFNQILYTLSWGAIINQKPLKGGYDLPIKTGLAGYSKDYSPRLVSPLDLTSQLLYINTAKSSEWAKRQSTNKVKQNIPFTLGLLAGVNGMAYPYLASKMYTIYGDKRIVIFGHTHEPDLRYILTKTVVLSGIYANAGTWIDQKYVGEDGVTCSYVEIIECNGYLGQYKRVCLKQFVNASTINNVKSPLWIYTNNN